MPSGIFPKPFVQAIYHVVLEVSESVFLSGAVRSQVVVKSRGRCSIIVRTALGDFDAVFDDSVHRSVCVVDSPAPVALLVMFERLRFADAPVPVAVNILNKLIDAAECFFVLRLPVQIIFPCFVGPDFIHR